MKNLIEYIEECGEGCAAPGNTMGMGNPMPPTGDQPGTEPIGSIVGPKKEKKNTSKRKKKVNESILDIEKNKEDMDKHIVIAWLEKVGGEGQAAKATVNDDLSISISYGFYMDLSKGESIPDYIKFKEIHKLDIECEGDLVIPDGFLPKNKEIHSINIGSYQSEDITVKFEAKTIKAAKCSISGNFTSIVFPKDFKCGELNMSSCEKLMNVENLTSVKNVNFPTTFGVNLIRKTLKYKGEIKMNGFGPY